ncbi:MAG: hypothetical protein AMJ68_10615 [Acidithiobacillales bacterium SG8_45]|jgi:hydroxyethylthiazole kinase-like uncharacterized protein yjeF|nr:MAG: hypothetical protein AMJ68_10615 [Acidithiobacillales bacterium SG8_45]
MPLPVSLYLAEQVRELDRLAIRQEGLGDGQLMERAGEAAYGLLRHRWPRARRLAVVCGPGNNGGDGYVLSRLAMAEGFLVRLLSLGDLLRQQDDALAARKAFEQSGGVISPFDAAALADCDLVVDAIFGTGLESEVVGEFADAIAAINGSRLPVLALDIPSGLHTDRGVALGTAVEASETLCFVGLKAGMLTADGPDYCGRLRFDSLGIPDAVYQQVEPYATRINGMQLDSLFPPRRRNSHKGDYGRVLIVGGGPGMAGAARLAGEAALYCGAGLVQVATHPEHANTLSAARPELIVHGVSNDRQLKVLMQSADVLALGPGLGQSDWAKSLLATVLESGLPKVLDADGLRLLAVDPVYNEDWVLTPHPGEAAALLDTGTAEVQADRFRHADAIAKQYGGVCVLKGCGSIVAADKIRRVCACGNPALATAGSGDLLTGAVAAFAAQGLSLVDAAAAAVWVHGHAADVIARNGERGWLASEFLPAMRNALHHLETKTDER